MKLVPNIAIIIPMLAVSNSLILGGHNENIPILERRLDITENGSPIKSNGRQTQALALSFIGNTEKHPTKAEEDVEDVDEEDVPEEVDIYGERGSAPPEVVVSSKKSYIGEFLSLYHPPITSKEIKASVDSEHISPSKLVSTIDYTGNRMSNPQNLRPYTELMNKKVYQQEAKYKDISYKKYGHKKHTNNTSTSCYYRNHLDIPSFINYLKTQGFNLDDLEFLTKPDLNYGFDEIEKELDKIENNPVKEPEAIVIGGEPVVNGSLGLAPKIALLILVFIALVSSF